MKIKILTSIFSLIFGLGIIGLFIYRADFEYRPPKKPINNYNKMIIRNNKANGIKQSIVSTLEKIAYMQWSIDSLELVENKYKIMDSTLIERLEDIRFEFGFSDMLANIEKERSLEVDGYKYKDKQSLSISDKKGLIISQIDSLRFALDYHKRSLDTVRSLSRHKFYLKQPRFSD